MMIRSPLKLIQFIIYIFCLYIRSTGPGLDQLALCRIMTLHIGLYIFIQIRIFVEKIDVPGNVPRYQDIVKQLEP